MIKPKFTLNLNDISFLNTDLEYKIHCYGLNILPYGVIDKDSHNTTAKFENIQFNQMVSSIREFLNKKNQEEFIEIFWSDSNKHSVKCKIGIALKFLHDIAAEDWDFWIFGDNWIIEYYHEGILSYFENCSINCPVHRGHQ